MEMRMTEDQRAIAFNLLRKGEIAHAFKMDHLQPVKTFTEWQHEAGIFGSVGEMGVRHGGFFIVLQSYALRHEPAVAIDLFNEQHLNVDGSGFTKTGHLGPFSTSMDKVGLNISAIQLIVGDTVVLTAETFVKRGIPKFRFLSVDAGHTLEQTLHDLTLAACVVADGGIVVLDDYINGHWLGVVQAAIHFTTGQDQLVPFMWLANKLYFTTKEWHKTYLDKIFKSSSFACNLSKTHVSRHSLNEFQLCG
jgi:hypothetical protein